MTDIDDRLRKLLRLAGHPATNENEAVAGMRAALRLLEAHGATLDDITICDAGSDFQRRGEESRRRRMEALEKRVAQQELDLQDARRENRDLQQKMTAMRKEIASERKRGSELAAENKRLKKLAPSTAEAATKPKAARPAALRASDDQSETADLQRIIRVLQALRQIDPQMSLKAGLSFLVAVTHNGLTANELADRIGQTSEASVRYGMRALGHGWQDKRAGLDLVMVCADPDGGRARLYVATRRGRTLRDTVLAVFRSADARGQGFKLAA
jgi:hypothetical protein